MGRKESIEVGYWESVVNQGLHLHEVEVKVEKELVVLEVAKV